MLMLNSRPMPVIRINWTNPYH